MAKKTGHEPTPEARAMVEALVRAGFDPARIAALMRISRPELRAHYRFEIETANDRALADVKDALFTAATMDGSVLAMREWLAAHGAGQDDGQQGRAAGMDEDRLVAWLRRRYATQGDGASAEGAPPQPGIAGHG